MTVHGNHSRRDILTGRQVIIAAAREQRPTPLQTGHTPAPAVIAAADDPFLEGQEAHTPDERLALRHTDTLPNTPGWLVRVVPNRYPAVIQADDATTSTRPETSPHAELYGQHDVVVECPDDRTQLQQLSIVQITRVLLAWQKRLLQLQSDGRFPYVRIFRNQGAMAGASLPHCHSQIVATSLPDESASMPLWRAPLTENGENPVFLQWKQAELAAETRLLEASAEWFIVCPFASRFSWQTRLCPGAKTPDQFTRLTIPQLTQLAERLKSVCLALTHLAGEVSFNLTLTLPDANRPDAFPWMLDVLPRPGRIAGFELMTGVNIVTVAPESAAAQFRQTMNREPADLLQDGGQSDASPVTPAGYHWHPAR